MPETNPNPVKPAAKKLLDAINPPVFKQGDHVMVTTGGPAMVVLSHAKNDKIVTCGWFIRERGGMYISYHREEFPPICLVKYGA